MDLAMNMCIDFFSSSPVMAPSVFTCSLPYAQKNKQTLKLEKKGIGELFRRIALELDSTAIIRRPCDQSSIAEPFSTCGHVV